MALLGIVSELRCGDFRLWNYFTFKDSEFFKRGSTYLLKSHRLAKHIVLDLQWVDPPLGESVYWGQSSKWSPPYDLTILLPKLRGIRGRRPHSVTLFNTQSDGPCGCSDPQHGTDGWMLWGMCLFC